MSNVIDVPRLIAEVQKRPAIWDGRQKARQFLPKLWDEVAASTGSDVRQCKRKWKNLRDAYRAEVRRHLRSRQSDKFMDSNEPPQYKSKWIHFPKLTFLNESAQTNDFSVDNDTNNSNSNDHSDDLDTTHNDCYTPEQKAPPLENVAELEPSHYIEINKNFNEDADDTVDNDLLFEEFESIATPQAATKLSAAFAMNNSSTSKTNSASNRPSAALPTATTASKCKCSQNTREQVDFLQDLGREEQKLMKSTRQDMTRYNKLDHVGDFDYNFLVSFLPQMKKMSELQNLQFRAKMSETVLRILTDTTAQDTSKTYDNQLPPDMQNII